MSWYQRVRLHPPNRYTHGGVVHSINGSDSINVRLNAGEWRIPAHLATHYSQALLDRLNQ